MKTNKVKQCPYCGAHIPINALSCQECGSDEQTGWSDQIYMDGVDIDEDFNYEESRRREFSSERVPFSKLHIVIATVLLLLFAVLVVKSIL